MANELQDLVAQMRWNVDHSEKLSLKKPEARRNADCNYSWKENDKCIDKAFNAVHRLDSAESEQIALEVSQFERTRTRNHKLSRYLLLRAMIEHEYPRVFRIASRLRSAMRA